MELGRALALGGALHVVCGLHLADFTGLWLTS